MSVVGAKQVRSLTNGLPSRTNEDCQIGRGIAEMVRRQLLLPRRFYTTKTQLRHRLD